MDCVIFFPIFQMFAALLSGYKYVYNLVWSYLHSNELESKVRALQNGYI